MYYGLVYYYAHGIGQINQLRYKYDPTADVIAPHITILFPVPDSVGEERLIGHIENVLAGRPPFTLRLGGLQKSPDHWLFITLAEGAEEIAGLYEALYTGLLEEFRRDDIEFVPHLGLGLLIKKGVQYDWNNPRESDLDDEAFESAKAEAGSLELDAEMTVARLHLVSIPDDVIEWASGERPDFSLDSRAADVKVFRLQARA